MYKRQVLSNTIRPTRLFPIDLNKKSHIPQLTKSKSNLTEASTILPLEKENINMNMNNNIIVEATPGRMELNSRFSSPYKEPDHSIYKLSLSPEGKFRLNVQQTDLDNPFEDTSIMDDEETDKCFQDWKTEQLAKLNDRV